MHLCHTCAMFGSHGNLCKHSYSNATLVHTLELGLAQGQSLSVMHSFIPMCVQKVDRGLPAVFQLPGFNCSCTVSTN